MAVKTNQYITRLTQDTSRGPSRGIWGDCPVENFLQTPGDVQDSGNYFFDDFIMFPGLFAGTAGQTASAAYLGQLGQWGVWSDQYGATVTDANLEGGVIGFNPGSHNTVNTTLSSTAGAFRLINPVTPYPLGQKLWFECRVALGSISTTKRDFFVGLADGAVANTVLTATAGFFSGANLILATSSSPGLLGFHFRQTTNPTDVGVVYNIQGGTPQYPTNLQTLINTVTGTPNVIYAAANGAATAGFVKLGFVFDPTPGNESVAVSASPSTSQTTGVVTKPAIQFFVNGQVCATFLDLSHNIQQGNFPATWLAPTIAYLSGSASAATTSTAYIDWIRVAQLANS